MGDQVLAILTENMDGGLAAVVAVSDLGGGLRGLQPLSASALGSCPDVDGVGGVQNEAVATVHRGHLHLHLTGQSRSQGQAMSPR